MSRIVLYFVFLLLLSSCGQSDKSVENINSKILFEEIKPIQQQLNPNIQINLSKLVKDNSFINNNTNNNGHINFEPTFEKKKTFKFSKIKQFNSIDTDILFIENNDLIYFDNKGTIFRINENFETLWKANHYSKKERKLNPILRNIVGKKVGEGVFGVSFKIKGPPGDLETTVNPIKTLTPRFITRTLEKIKKN